MNNRTVSEIIADRYQIVRKLGKGGTGDVYLVQDNKLNKKWALKLLHNRSTQELSALCSVNHTSFPRIVDSGISGDRHYIVMDYIEGIPMYAYVQINRCSTEERLSLALQLAEALEYLHTASPAMLYLDCKPDNILIDYNGRLHLVDMGSIYMKDMSNPGRISGTSGFASPEQRLGSSVDIRSDIYAYGQTLIRLLGTASGDKYKSVIRHCLADNPDKRFQSMSEVINALHNRGLRFKASNYIMELTKVITKSLFCLFSIMCFKEYIATHEYIFLLQGILLVILFCMPILIRKEKYIMNWTCHKNIHMGRGIKIIILLGAVALAALLLGSNTSLAKERYNVTLYDSTGHKILFKDQKVFLRDDGTVQVCIPTRNITADTMPVMAEYELKW